MKRLSLYFTQTRSTVIIEHEGFERETSAKSMVQVIQNMNAEDRELFVQFCTAVVRCSRDGDCKALADF
jgi:hypothetical protein